MVSLQDIQNAYERGVNRNADKWKERASRATDDYREGLMAIDGISNVSSDVVRAYEEGVGRVSSSEYQQSVEGQSDKMIENYEEAIQG